MIRGPRSAVPLLLLFLQVALLDTGSLSAAVAVAFTATAAAGSALAVSALIGSRCAPAARPSCRNATPTPKAAPGPERRDRASWRPSRRAPPSFPKHPEAPRGSLRALPGVFER